MFRIADDYYRSSVTLPATAAANPCDNDGVLTDSEPHIQGNILDGAARVAGLAELTPDQMKLVQSTFGQPDNLMSQSLFDKLSADTGVPASAPLRGLDRESFVPHFVEVRRAAWAEATSSGKVLAKPGALDYVNEFRTPVRLLGIVTGMPFDLAGESIKHVLRADEVIPLNRERRICCDDPRLAGVGKPDPRPYNLQLAHFVDEFDIDPRDMWTIEDRANGAVSALQAVYEGPNTKYQGHQIGHVIVIPDQNDTVPIELWDRKLLVERHLAAVPDDFSRLLFLRSLRDLSFVR